MKEQATVTQLGPETYSTNPPIRHIRFFPDFERPCAERIHRNARGNDANCKPQTASRKTVPSPTGTQTRAIGGKKATGVTPHR